MLKFTCAVLLAVAATVSCIPVAQEPSKAGLVRPSPINPDVVSEPLPDGVTTTTQAARESHIQKIPARGTKLSATLDQDKSTTTSESPKEKRETATDATNATPAKSNFRRDQPSTPSTAHKQAGVTTSTVEPVSLKTPIVHPSGLKVRRSADDTTTTTNKTPSGGSTTTRGPLPGGDSSSSSNSDDNSGPHFIRPVPVDQILKNLHEATPQHHQSTHHEQAKAVEATTSSAVDGETSAGTTVNDHKFHRKNKTTTTTEEPAEDEEQDSHDDGKESSEEDSKQDKQ